MTPSSHSDLAKRLERNVNIALNHGYQQVTSTYFSNWNWHPKLRLNFSSLATSDKCKMKSINSCDLLSFLEDVNEDLGALLGAHQGGQNGSTITEKAQNLSVNHSATSFERSEPWTNTYSHPQAYDFQFRSFPNMYSHLGQSTQIDVTSLKQYSAKQLPRYQDSCNYYDHQHYSTHYSQQFGPPITQQHQPFMVAAVPLQDFSPECAYCCSRAGRETEHVRLSGETTSLAIERAI